eukprot:8289513-Alexandrium_andersonii.AAC.1
MHPLGTSGASVEAFPGPAQFRLRTLDAILCCAHGGLPIEADCSVDGPWADGGLLFGHPAM